MSLTIRWDRGFVMYSRMLRDAFTRKGYPADGSYRDLFPIITIPICGKLVEL